MDQKQEDKELLGYVFAVADSPYCCWDFDHEARSLEFLDGLDSGYFGTLASICADRLTAEDALAVSVILRVGYHQGVETLMSLLGAALQAPSAIPAWIAKCSTRELKEVAVALRDGRSVLTQRGRQRVSFSELSEGIHRYAWTDETGEDSTAAGFGRLWHRLSGEFLDGTARAEYNALKHGNRVLAGGFTIALGIEETPGVPAPPNAMRPLGGSRFGSTFFVGERVGTSKEHIRTRRTSVNWSPEALAQRLYLVSLSISNIVGALRCELGVDPTTVTFARPDPISAFDDVWKHGPSARSIGMDAVIRIDRDDERSRDELLKILEERNSSDVALDPSVEDAAGLADPGSGG